MEDEFANRLGMFRTVLTTVNLPTSKAVWQGNQPLAFGAEVNDATTAVADLELFVIEHGKDISGSAADKNREQAELETAAHQLGSALASWFRKSKDDTNRALVERSMSGWRRLRDEQLAQQSQIVIDTAQAVVAGPAAAAAANYGVTAAAIASLTKERNDYVAVIAAPQQKIASRKSLTQQYRTRFNAVEAHFDELDNLVLQYRTTPAGRNFAAAYQAARIIRDLGHGPSPPPPAPPA